MRFREVEVFFKIFMPNITSIEVEKEFFVMNSNQTSNLKKEQVILLLY